METTLIHSIVVQVKGSGLISLLSKCRKGYYDGCGLLALLG